MNLLEIILYLSLVICRLIVTSGYNKYYDLILNESKKWSDGTWIHNDSFVPLFTEHHFEHTHCRTRLSRISPTAYDSSLKWVWVPNNHNNSYTIPRKHEFCHSLHQRNILVVGDSLSWEFFDTIVDFTYNGTCSASQFDQIPKPCTICHGRNKIMFVRNDLLSTVPPNEVVPGVQDGNFVEYSWINYIISGEYQIAVLNRGAHYLPDPVLKDNLRLLNFYLNNSDIRNKTTIFYRNSAPGHENCQNYKLPVKSFVVTNENFHWTKFYKQNQIMQDYFYKIGSFVIDAYSSSLYRPDSHVEDGDCLHYCIPGPIDTWMIFFYNLLKLDNLNKKGNELVQ